MRKQRHILGPGTIDLSDRARIECIHQKLLRPWQRLHVAGAGRFWCARSLDTPGTHFSQFASLVDTVEQSVLLNDLAGIGGVDGLMLFAQLGDVVRDGGDWWIDEHVKRVLKEGGGPGWGSWLLARRLLATGSWQRERAARADRPRGAGDNSLDNGTGLSPTAWLDL